MSYHRNAATITITREGQTVTFTPNYDTKTVSVYVGAEYVGSWHCHTAAKEALGLIDVPAKKERH